MQLTYQKEFFGKLKSGEKVHTIRKIGERYYCQGTILQHYPAGYPIGKKVKIIPDTIVCDVVGVEFCKDFLILWKFDYHYIKAEEIGKFMYNHPFVKLLAKNDGFETDESFVKYFKAKKRFTPYQPIFYQLISWKPLFKIYPELNSLEALKLNGENGQPISYKVVKPPEYVEITLIPDVPTGGDEFEFCI